MAKTETAVPDSLQRMVALAKQEDQSVMTADQIAEDIAQRILSAETVDDVLGPRGTTPAEELLNVPVTIESVRWLQSAIKDGLPVYCLVQGRLADSGETVTVSCGSRNVMTQLYRIGELDGFPVTVMFGQSDRPTAAGFHPMWLTRP